MMNCEKIISLLPLYIDDELTDQEKQIVIECLSRCAKCRKELQKCHDTWELLNDAPAIEPQPNYVSAFWSKLAQQPPTPWYIHLWEQIVQQLKSARVAAALATMGLVVFCIAFFQKQYAKPNIQMVHMDLEMMDHMELIENYDIIEDIDLLVDLDVIESLDNFDV